MDLTILYHLAFGVSHISCPDFLHACPSGIHCGLVPVRMNRKLKLLEQQLCAVAVKFRLKVHVVWVAIPPIHHIGMPLAEFLQHSVAHKLGHHTAVFQVVKPRWNFFYVQGGYVLKQNLPSTKGGSILFPGQAILLYGRMFQF